MTRRPLVGIFAALVVVAAGSISAQEVGATQDRPGRQVLGNLTVTRDSGGVVRLTLSGHEGMGRYDSLFDSGGENLGQATSETATVQGKPGRANYVSAIQIDNSGQAADVYRGLVYSQRTIDQASDQRTSPVSYIANTENILIFWEPVDGIGEWTVYRGGTKIGSTTETRFVTEHQGGQGRTEFSVRGTTTHEKFLQGPNDVTLDLGQHDTEDGASVDLGIWVEDLPSADDLRELPADVVEQAKPQGVTADGENRDSHLAGEAETSSVQTQSTPDNTTIRMRTFIQNDYISAQYSTCAVQPLNRWFKGDQRTYHSPTSGTNRTQVDIYMSWATGNTSIIPETGLTKLYGQDAQGDWEYLDKKQAGTSGVSGDTDYYDRNPDEYEFDMSHRIGNPFCYGAYIDASYDATSSHIAEDQYYRLTARHDRFPSMSFYYKDNTSTAFEPIYYWNQGNHYCLEACFQNNFDRTGFAY